MAARRPNIIIITAHDLGRFVGCLGIKTVPTPNIDAFAADGVKFTRAFCTAPQCSPSRASLYTGRYPHSNGVMGLTHDLFGWDLYPDERHLGQILGDEGYAGTIIGNHHETAVSARCGVDEILWENKGAKVTDIALDRLKHLAGQDRPFYLQVGYFEPHRAIGPDESDYMGFKGNYITPHDSSGVTIPPYLRDTPLGRVELAELQGAVKYLDTHVGRLFDGIEEGGVARDSLVIFTTDHGVGLPRAKCSLYDPGLEVALMVRLPRGWNGGRIDDSLVSNVDVVPTLLELLGMPAAANLQGKSFLDLLDRKSGTPRDAIYGELTYHAYYDPQRCIRTDRHKLIVNFSPSPAFMDSSQSWRPRTDPVIPKRPPDAFHPILELYDLAADPWEQHNLASEESWAETRNGLLAKLGDWMRQTSDPLLEGAITALRHRQAIEMLGGA